MAGHVPPQQVAHLLVGDAQPGGVGVVVEHRLDGRSGCRLVVAAMVCTTTSWLDNGRPPPVHGDVTQAVHGDVAQVPQDLHPQARQRAANVKTPESTPLGNGRLPIMSHVYSLKR
jgi:hypothetical protein